MIINVYGFRRFIKIIIMQTLNFYLMRTLQKFTVYQKLTNYQACLITGGCCQGSSSDPEEEEETQQQASSTATNSGQAG